MKSLPGVDLIIYLRTRLSINSTHHKMKSHDLVEQNFKVILTVCNKNIRPRNLRITIISFLHLHYKFLTYEMKNHN